MLISLNWIRDFIDLPDDLDPRALAERLTRTTAEVDDVRRIEVRASGLIAAKILNVTSIPVAAEQKLHAVTLDVGCGRTVETVTTAPAIRAGQNVVYAPVGSSVAALGDIVAAKVAGKPSAGLILPGEAVGIEKAFQEAIFLSDEFKSGEPLPADVFDDWVIDIDNKSITNRPDLWGQYGIAREIAAILHGLLKPCPVVALEELTKPNRPEVIIKIADPRACRRYTGLIVEGVAAQPAPLWIQLRLGHVGQRPISGLVDLTNYIMMDLGQPMHAFDAEKVDRIEVDWAKEGERFKTLDGVERTLTRDGLMIQSGGRSVALAGVMGGLEAEVSDATTALLLESANFDPATIRKTAKKLGLRSEASARFEKSLDPTNTVLAIQRFLQLARSMYPRLKLTSRLSDCFPNPRETVTVRVNPRHVVRTIGRDVPLDEARRLLKPIGFKVTEHDTHWTVDVPSFRATGDCSIEADIVEELARLIGYGTIAPTMPRVAVRCLPPNDLHELEQSALRLFTAVEGFHEIQGYIWYDAAWLRRLGADPGRCVELANPAAEGTHQLRRTLLPGLLNAVALNRFHFPALSLVELGSVFEKGDREDRESRHLGLVLAQRGKRAEDELYARLKSAVAGWTWRQFARSAAFAETTAAADRPWEHPHRTAAVAIDGIGIGRLSVINLSLRRVMDEHLAAWSIAWAELQLTGLECLQPLTEPLASIPPFPLVDLDFSILVPKTTRYAEVAANLRRLDHPLLKTIRFVTAYEGDAIAKDRRSLTFRTVLGCDDRTLTDADGDSFRAAFAKHLKSCGYDLRAS
jgi:phenylalanyl-tRNA synthetase beta chain